PTPLPRHCTRSVVHLIVLIARFSLLLHRHPPASTLFPYTTLFRSSCRCCTPAPTCPARPAKTSTAGGRSPPSSRQRSSRRAPATDRKSTRLNSSHEGISYAVFCLKKKNRQHGAQRRAR